MAVPGVSQLDLSSWLADSLKALFAQFNVPLLFSQATNAQAL
jgi:hypothetical protein